MNAYQAYMAEQIAKEIKSIEDPYILTIYLRAILHQRCKLGGVKEYPCYGCMYKNYYCRQLLEMTDIEARIFEDKEEE